MGIAVESPEQVSPQKQAQRGIFTCFSSPRSLRSRSSSSLCYTANATKKQAKKQKQVKKHDDHCPHPSYTFAGSPALAR